MRKLTFLMRRFKFLIIKLLRLKDHSHKVALGFSLGSIVNFIPTFGFGLMISVGLAKLCKDNSIAGLIGGMLFMWAFPLLFYLNMVVGGYIFPVDLDQTFLDAAFLVSFD
ncbi:DUF2062 domain-containing protein [Priestia megaterium]